MNLDLHALGRRSSRLLATGMENTKEEFMKLRDWEQTVQQITEESNQEPKESGKSKVLVKWRAKLAQEPHLLQPYEIDEIVRAVRKRLSSISAQPSSLSPVPLTLAASASSLT